MHPRTRANNAGQRTAGSHALAATAHRERLAVPRAFLLPLPNAFLTAATG